MGKRTRAIERKLRQVEQLPHEESRKILPIEEDGELFDSSEKNSAKTNLLGISFLNARGRV